MLERSEEAMGDFRRTAFRRKPRSGGSDEQPEEEEGEFSVTSKVTHKDHELDWRHIGLQSVMTF